MASAQSVITQQYQQSIWGEMDRTLRNCFVGSAILGLLVLIATFVIPLPPPMPVSVDDIPERIARLILEPKPAAPDIPGPERAKVTEEPKVETPKPVIKQKPRRTSKPKVARNQGVEGRQKAQKEVTQNLAQVTGSLDKVLNNLSKSLPASEASGDEKTPQRRRRGVRSGRTSQQLSSVQGVSNVASPEMSESAIAGDGISIAAITDLTVDDGGGGLGGASKGVGGSGSSQNDFRSNESLLAVVRRYAPGIQFCYDNELKKNPGLRGKLVVSLTVRASGDVSDVIVVQDGLGSRAVVDCVLSQIRGWQFPEIPHGDTSFKTPFVFTPPE